MRLHLTVAALVSVASLLILPNGATGHAMAQAERYQVDPMHSSVVFRVKHMNVANFYGRFNEISGTVEIDEDGKIHAMYLKPGTTDLELCWLGGVWTPVFTQFMHEYLQRFRKKNDFKTSEGGELEAEDLTVGAVIQAAISKGLQTYGVVFPEGKYIDIGTPDNLLKSLKMFGCQLT